MWSMLWDVVFVLLDYIVQKNVVDDWKVCSAIVDLENVEKEKFYREIQKSDMGCNLPLKLNREIVRLVGERPWR